jgi:hypothetical protein
MRSIEIAQENCGSGTVKALMKPTISPPLTNGQRATFLQVWTVVEHCIERDPWLLQNRHIDSIMLCSVYSICKVRERLGV